MGTKKSSSYVAKPVDSLGNTTYTNEENAIWHDLIVRQLPIIQNRACNSIFKDLSYLIYRKMNSAMFEVSRYCMMRPGGGTRSCPHSL